MDALDKFATIEELEARKAELKSRLQEIDQEYAGKPLVGEVRDEWNSGNEEVDAITERVDELKARAARIVALADEQPAPYKDRVGFSAAVPKEHSQGDNIYDLSTVVGRADAPETMVRELRDRAMKAIEIGRYGDGDKAKMQEGAERTLRNAGDRDGRLARQFLATGSPLYERAFTKHLAQHPLTNDEARAMAIGAGADGGYLLPFTLDPSIILTSNGVINPMRSISRVVQTTTNEWKGVTTAQGTASYVAEGDEAGDKSTQLAQPAVEADRAQFFIPFSVELDQDWGALRSELGMLVQEAKDALEADKFLNGTGTTQPTGLHNKATAVVTSSSTANFTVADVYAVKDALPPRFQANATFVSNNSIQSKIRQLDTAGGGAFWANLRDGDQDRLIGYPIRQYSAMTSVLTTASTILTIGDFSKYLIVDRVGMSAEVIPHLFGGTANYPTGQRGFYALWRNGATVLAWQAFRSLKTL